MFMVMSRSTKCFLQTQHLSWMCLSPVIMWFHSHTEVVTNRKLDRPGAKAALQQVRSQHALSLLVRLCHLLQGRDDNRIMWLTSVTKHVTVKWCSEVRKRRRCKSLLMLTCAASSNVGQLEQLNCICLLQNRYVLCQWIHWKALGNIRQRCGRGCWGYLGLSVGACGQQILPLGFFGHQLEAVQHGRFA